MGQGAIEHCSICNRSLVLLLPPGGAGPRTLQCFDCDRQDPLESFRVKRWLEGELGRGLVDRVLNGWVVKAGRW
jgi:hypothetical protein